MNNNIDEPTSGKIGIEMYALAHIKIENNGRYIDSTYASILVQFSPGPKVSAMSNVESATAKINEPTQSFEVLEDFLLSESLEYE